MRPRPLIVAGLGRCGTTLAMTMLAKAGVPTVGTAPDYEDMAAQRTLETDPAAWAAMVEGRAVKVLDAHRFKLPRLDTFDMIWLARDPAQQARSMLKVMAQPQSRRSRLAMERGIAKDMPKAIGRLSTMGTMVNGMVLRFERMILEPRRVAAEICERLEIDPARADAMGDCVIPRAVSCLPYLLERSLVA